MAGKDIIIMRQKELKRLHVIGKVMERELTQVEAAEILSLSEIKGYSIDPVVRSHAEDCPKSLRTEL